MIERFGSACAFTICMVVAAGDVYADPYAITESSAPSILRGASIDPALTIELAAGEAIGFIVRGNGASVQRKCVGPFKGELRNCTNNSARPSVGIPGGSRGDE